MACKPCEANRRKKGDIRHFSTEQQAAIARARENGEEVNITVARSKPRVQSKKLNNASRGEA